MIGNLENKMINFNPDDLVRGPVEPSAPVVSTYHPASVRDNAKVKSTGPSAGFLAGLHVPVLPRAFEAGQMSFSGLTLGSGDGDADNGSPVDQLQGDDPV